MLRKFAYWLLRLLPIKRNRILFIGYYGAQYGCNPKYISRHLAAHHGDEVEIVWAFTDLTRHKIDGVRMVKFGSLQYLMMLATSRVICTNYRMTADFEKRQGQVYIQSWHSSLRLKKIERDTEASLPPHYVTMAKHDSAQTDYVIAGCQMSHNTFANSFWYSGEIIDAGTPRNDVLLSPPEGLAAEIKRRLNIEPSRKLVLYAPTFRKDKSTDCYRLDFAAMCRTLSSKFGGEWTVLLRLHPHLTNCELFSNIANVIDVTRYDDIQELLLISDVLVSDYSSLMFDFAISGKPVFLFATDVDDYCRNDRALYFDIHDLPFSLAVSNEELQSQIISFSNDEYKQAISQFDKIVGSFERGNASEKVSQLIMSKIKS